MVVTNRDDLAERVRLLRSHGMTTLTWDRHKGHAASYDVVNPGYNYRLDELHAALGRAQLKKLERNNQRRRNFLVLYREAVQSLGGWTMPFADTIEHSSGHLMVTSMVGSPGRSSSAITLNQTSPAAIQFSRSSCRKSADFALASSSVSVMSPPTERP